MLASHVKKQEVETLKDLWDIVGIAYTSALRTGNAEITVYAQELEQRAIWWKERIVTHDYSEDDHRWQVVTKALNDKNK